MSQKSNTPLPSPSSLFELGVLKRMRRAGWWHVGVRDPESVAEHSLRVAQLASLNAAIEGAEPGPILTSVPPK